MFVHLADYNAKYNPPENYRIHRRKQHFSILIGFQNANEIDFHVFGNLVVWLWKKFGRVLQIFKRSVYGPVFIVL